MIYRLIVVSCFAAVSFAQSYSAESYSAQSYSTNEDPQLALYLEQALDRNPAVRQSFARYRAALQRLPQVSALPDPVLGFTRYFRSPDHGPLSAEDGLHRARWQCGHPCRRNHR